MSFGNFGGAFKKKKQSLGPGNGSNKNNTFSKMATKRLSKMSKRLSESTNKQAEEESSGGAGDEEEDDSVSQDESPYEPGTVKNAKGGTNNNKE